MDGPPDVAAVNALQDRFQIRTLDDWRAGRDSPPCRFDARFVPRAPFSVERFVAMVNDALQHAPPLDATARANWLPAPEGAFFLCLRAYLPRPEMMDGSYRLPEPQRLA